MTNTEHRLFEYINNKVPAWPKNEKVRDDLANDIAGDVEHKLRQFTAPATFPNGVIEAVARCVALFLIEQAAWCKYEKEENQS